MTRINLSLAAMFLALVSTGACRRDATLSTDDIVGEWRKPGSALPPINLLISSEGPGLRATLRLAGAESRGRVKVEGQHLTVKFDDQRAALEGTFVSKTELTLRLRENGEVYRLKKRP